MLYMCVISHSPDLCPMANKDVREKYILAAKEGPNTTKSLGITVQGGWANELIHASYILVDAPNAHAITQFLSKLHYLDWNTATVNPVYTREEVAAQIQNM
jgi:hypothetical protein